MPIYEYRCQGCGATVSVFQRSIGAPQPAGARCDRCGSADLSRLLSRFAFHRAGGAAGDFDEAALMAGLDENDPASVARWARRMGDTLGEDLPPDFDQMVREMETGGPPADDGLGGNFEDDL